MLKTLFMAAVLAAWASLVGADERVTLGWGRLFSNDLIDNGADRWRSGSYSVTLVRGVSWSGHESHGFGEIVALSGHAAAITPANLTAPSPTDRRYAGVASFGLASHFGWQGAEVALGGELALTGPATGVGSFQKWFHGLAGFTQPSAAVLNAQIGNRLHPGLNAEIGRSLALGGTAEVRPFLEVRAGLETLVRFGGDITFGKLGKDDLMLRDVGTGQRYRGVEGIRETGLSLTLGGDMARVFESALLPDGGAVSASATRTRLRAGLHWQGRHAAAFYGVSYLSQEFDEQPEGQLVGALSLNLRF